MEILRLLGKATEAFPVATHPVSTLIAFWFRSINAILMNLPFGEALNAYSREI